MAADRYERGGEGGPRVRTESTRQTSTRVVGVKLRALVLSTLLVVSALSVGGAVAPAAAQAGNAGNTGFVDVVAGNLPGEGTESNPYEISNASELQAVNDDLDAHYELVDDVNASGTADWNDGKGFEPIQGSEPLENVDDRFSGTFDGQDHAISNLTINRTGEQYDKELTDTVKSSVGLFGFVGEGTITNVSLANVNVTGIVDGETTPYVGALAAYSLGGTVSNVSVSGTVNGTGITDPTGGLVGQNEEATIVDSSSSANVTAGETDEVGGLVGLNLGYTDGSSILNSTASGNVTGDEDVGGLVGNTLGGDVSSVSNSTASGDVTGSGINVGGLVGNSDGFDVSSVSNSTASGDVTGSGINVGGLIGNERGTLVNGSSASGDVTGDRRVGGLVGVARTTVRESYALGDVTGTEQVGGLVGFVRTDTTIKHSYAVGTVSDATNAGGLVGESDGTVTDAYWDTESTTQSASAGGEGLDTSEMTGLSAAGNMTGFDFQSNWTTVPGEYPVLAWQDVGQPPAANDDSYAAAENETLSISAPGVLGNDTDADDDALTATVVTTPSNGTLDLSANGSFTYTPDDGFSGEDSFTYEASDGNDGADQAGVTITVDPAPSAGGGDDDNTGDDTGGDDDPSDGGVTDDDGPDVTVRTANVSQTTVETGETVTVNATLATEGDRAANDTIALHVDDQPVRNETLNVPAEGNRTVTITHTFDDPGEYALAIGNESVGPITVESDGATTTGTADGSDETTDTADGEASTSPGTSTTEQTTDGSGPGFGAVAAVLAFLATALLARRRR